MLDRGGGLGLAFEPRDSFPFLKVIAAENILSNRFDRDLTRRELIVVRQIDLSHRSAAKPFHQQIAFREELRTRQRQPCRGHIAGAPGHLIRVTLLTFWALAHLIRFYREGLRGGENAAANNHSIRYLN